MVAYEDFHYVAWQMYFVQSFGTFLGNSGELRIRGRSQITYPRDTVRACFG